MEHRLDATHEICGPIKPYVQVPEKGQRADEGAGLVLLR